MVNPESRVKLANALRGIASVLSQEADALEAGIVGGRNETAFQNDLTLASAITMLLTGWRDAHNTLLDQERGGPKEED